MQVAGRQVHDTHSNGQESLMQDELWSPIMHWPPPRRGAREDRIVSGCGNRLGIQHDIEPRLYDNMHITCYR